MSHDLTNENRNAAALTSVPVVLTTDGQLAHVLQLQASGQLVDNSYDSEDAATTSSSTSIVGTMGSAPFPMLFQTSNGCHISLMQSVTEAKPDMTLLHPVTQAKAASTASSLMLSKDQLSSTSSLLEPESSKSVNALPSSLGLHNVSRTLAEVPGVLSGGGLVLTDSVGGKALSLCASVKEEDGNSLNSLVSRAPVSLLKAESGAASLSMGLSEAGDAFDMDHDHAAPKKTPLSPASSIFPEGAVLVETPQGLMLSVGEELRAVTLMEGPDSHGNHLLSFSNNGIPVALLSQQGGLVEDQETGVVYHTGRDGDEASGLPSSGLGLGSEHALPGIGAQEGEPKRKSRGWPKGKKRKPAPLITGPRAPMTGYVLFAIKRRQEIKLSHPELPFSEVTKMLGQEWSTMPMDNKQKYLDDAEHDKQRYIDELKQLQKSEVYQTLVKKKRTDGDDAKDDSDNDLEDDGEELHCKVCQLYFSSLHNKKEHLLGKQHLQTITDQLKKGMKKQQQQREQEGEQLSDSLAGIEVGDLGDNSGLFLGDSSDGLTSQQCSCWTKPVNVSGAISDFVHRVFERDQEIFKLRGLVRKHSEDKITIYTQLQDLKVYESKLQEELRNLSAHTTELTESINNLKIVPALFGVEDL